MIFKIFSTFIFAINFFAVCSSKSLDCNFIQHPSLGYSCFVASTFNVTSNFDRSVDAVIGIHLAGKSNSDVVFLNFNQMTLNYFPTNLEIFFTNIDTLQVHTSKLKEIFRDDLKKFPNLKRLWLIKNEIDVIEGDLFAENLNLNHVVLAENLIYHVDQSAFRGMKSLSNLNFDNNPCYSGHSENMAATTILTGEIIKNCNNSGFLVGKIYKKILEKLLSLNDFVMRIDPVIKIDFEKY